MWCHHPCQCDIRFFMPLPSPSAGRYLVFTGGVRIRHYTHRYQFNIATFLVGAGFVSTISQLDLSRTNSKSEHSVEKAASIWNRPTMKELYHIYFEACWRSDTKRFNQNMKIFVRVFFRVLLLLVLVVVQHHPYFLKHELIQSSVFGWLKPTLLILCYIGVIVGVFRARKCCVRKRLYSILSLGIINIGMQKENEKFQKPRFQFLSVVPSMMLCSHVAYTFFLCPSCRLTAFYTRLDGQR